MPGTTSFFFTLCKFQPIKKDFFQHDGNNLGKDSLPKATMTQLGFHKINLVNHASLSYLGHGENKDYQVILSALSLQRTVNLTWVSGENVDLIGLCFFPNKMTLHSLFLLPRMQMLQSNISSNQTVNLPVSNIKHWHDRDLRLDMENLFFFLPSFFY